MVTWNPKANELFLEAVEKPAGRAREAYLDQACAGDADLRQQVLDLLEASEQAESFLESAPLTGLNAASHGPLSERVGAVIGPYKLLQQIGEGGMGVVFMAEQSHPIQRTVALKIIKPGMDTRQVIARFEAERQALAMMDHPNIAKVLDAGTTGEAARDEERGTSDKHGPAPTLVPRSSPLAPHVGRPYFVMELVKGIPVTKYCDQKQFSIRQRLELFLPICQAVQHAHQKGIIHRDIKPTNVLVAEYDDRAVPKIIDFGVAKATAQKLTQRTMFTEYGQLIGTVEYMSPEQAKFNQLDIDTRSDIYSLGVLLYELLTGTTPFEKHRLETVPFDETLRIIREEEPPLPSASLSSSQGLASLAVNRGLEPDKLSRTVRGELDWIVMKCLEKDRNRRYPTANALALDLQRYLNDEPVEARRPTRWYRLKKFIRRNKAGMFVASSIAAMLLAAIIILLVSNARIRREANVRDRALRAKDTALNEKDAALATAQEAVDRMLTRVASDRFSDMPLSHPLRIALLEDARAFYERLAAQMGADSSLHHKVASLLHTHAGLLREVGNYDRATLALCQSRDLLKALADTDPDPPTILEERARVEMDLAFTLHRGDETRLLTDHEAEIQYRRALELFDDLERGWPNRCEPAVLGHRMLAKLAFQRGDRAEALRLWRGGVALGAAYLKQHPGNLNVCMEVGWSCVHLCDALDSDSPDSMTEIEGVLTRGLEAVREALEQQPKSTRAADAKASLEIRLATLKCRQGHVDEALPLFERAVVGMEALCEGFPWTANYWNSLRWFHQEIALQLSAAGRPAAARHALLQFQKWLERVSPQMANGAGQQKQLRISREWLAELLRSTETTQETEVRIKESDATPH